MRATAWVAAIVAVGAGCALVPAERERAHVERRLRDQPGVARAEVGCQARFTSGAGLCADVTMAAGARLLFTGLGYRSFGPATSAVLVVEAGGLAPRIRSCGRDGVATVAALHRDGLFGHHFSPGLGDISEAVRRHREVVEELEFWPRCPQFWEVQDREGQNHRYCAQPVSAPLAPPPAPACP